MPTPNKLLTRQDSTYKLAKNADFDQGYITWIMYLAPTTSVTGMNTCPASTPGCSSACLYKAGRGNMHCVEAARVRRTEFLRDHEATFVFKLVHEIDTAIKYADRMNAVPAFRLNGTSDIDWPSLITKYFPDFYTDRAQCEFYEYTKRPDLALNPDSPVHYTFSRSESNDHVAIKVLSRGGNVAVVFEELPETWAGRSVISGDSHDMRFLDPVGPVIIGLSPKGPAKKDQSGFVVRRSNAS